MSIPIHWGATPQLKLKQNHIKRMSIELAWWFPRQFNPKIFPDGGVQLLLSQMN